MKFDILRVSWEEKLRLLDIAKECLTDSTGFSIDKGGFLLLFSFIFCLTFFYLPRETKFIVREFVV